MKSCVCITTILTAALLALPVRGADYRTPPGQQGWHDVDWRDPGAPPHPPGLPPPRPGDPPPPGAPPPRGDHDWHDFHHHWGGWGWTHHRGLWRDHHWDHDWGSRDWPLSGW